MVKSKQTAKHIVGNAFYPGHNYKPTTGKSFGNIPTIKSRRLKSKSNKIVIDLIHGSSNYTSLENNKSEIRYIYKKKKKETIKYPNITILEHNQFIDYVRKLYIPVFYNTMTNIAELGLSSTSPIKAIKSSEQTLGCKVNNKLFIILIPETIWNSTENKVELFEKYYNSKESIAFRKI